MIRRILRQFAHKVLFPAVELANVAVLSLFCSVRPAKLRQLDFTGRDRVLVIAPHPDDETLGCGGTIGLHLRAGDELRVVIITDGRMSRAGGRNALEMISLRRSEAQSAVGALELRPLAGDGKLELTQYMLPEGAWSDEQLYELLSQQIRQWKPTIIYAPSCVDFHPEHLRVARCVAGTLQGERDTSIIQIRAYELQVPLTAMLANVFADITLTSMSKYDALSKYNSQQGSFLWVRRHSRYLRAVYKESGPIEVFWEMRVQQFITAHSTPIARPAFRSIRLRPFTDLLAWVVGTKARRDLYSLVNKGLSSSE